MTEVLVIRHGESVSNILKLFTGQSDFELTDKGREQARVTGEFLSGRQIDAFYSSDLRRAAETGKIIASFHNNAPVTLTSELREINAGKWEGIPFDELATVYPEQYEVWMHHKGSISFEDGESAEQVKERVYACIKRLAEENEGKTILVATHAMALRCFVACVLKLTADEMSAYPWATNASVSVFRYDKGVFELVEHSIDAHLAQLRTSLPANV